MNEDRRHSAVRRLARHLFTLGSAVSLVLCVAWCALWVRSYFVWDWLGRVHYSPGIDKEDHHLWFRTNRGVFEVVGGGDPAENFPAVRWEWRHWPAERRGSHPADEPSLLRAAGVYWERPRRLETWEMTWSVRFPIALPALLSALGAVPVLVRVRRRHEPGTCPTCGYDLRASPRRCPECGAAAVSEISNGSLQP